MSDYKLINLNEVNGRKSVICKKKIKMVYDEKKAQCRREKWRTIGLICKPKWHEKGTTTIAVLTH